MRKRQEPKDYIDKLRADILRRAPAEAEPSELEALNYLTRGEEEPEGRGVSEEAVPPKPAPVVRKARCDVEQLGARLAAGRIANAKLGRKQSGPVPFGYRRGARSKDPSDRRGGLLEPNSQESGVLRYIFERYVALGTLQKLIDELERKGIRSRRGRRFSRQALAWILKNTVYIGRVTYKDVDVPGLHAGLVAPSLFRAANLLLEWNDKKTKRQPCPHGRKRRMCKPCRSAWQNKRRRLLSEAAADPSQERRDNQGQS